MILNKDKVVAWLHSSTTDTWVKCCCLLWSFILPTTCEILASHMTHSVEKLSSSAETGRGRLGAAELDMNRTSFYKLFPPRLHSLAHSTHSCKRQPPRIPHTCKCITSSRFNRNGPWFRSQGRIFVFKLKRTANTFTRIMPAYHFYQ